MTISIANGTAVIHVGGRRMKACVVDIERQEVEVYSRHGGRAFLTRIPVDDIINLVDPAGTKYARVGEPTADVHF